MALLHHQLSRWPGFKKNDSGDWVEEPPPDYPAQTFVSAVTVDELRCILFDPIFLATPTVAAGSTSSKRTGEQVPVAKKTRCCAIFVAKLNFNLGTRSSVLGTFGVCSHSLQPHCRLLHPPPTLAALQIVTSCRVAPNHPPSFPLVAS